MYKGSCIFVIQSSECQSIGEEAVGKAAVPICSNFAPCKPLIYFPINQCLTSVAKVDLFLQLALRKEFCEVKQTFKFILWILLV